jgi:predicted NBD/HSP70 family sugar kinase
MTTTIDSTKTIYKIGVDVGGTKINAVLLKDNKVIESYKLATPTDNLNHFVIIFKAAIAPLLERAVKDNGQVGFIGIGVPGTVNQHTGRVIACTNLPILNNLKLLSKLRADLNLPMALKLDNDANCFTRAEALLGAGSGFNNVYGITIGTGIGGAWWLNKAIYTGAHDGAGEICDMLVDLDSKVTLEEAYKKLTQNNPRLLAQEAYGGDVLAEKSFKELGEYLGMAFANLVNLLDPAIIVVGGGASASSDLFLKTAQKTMTKYIESSEVKKIRIITSKLGDHAGAIGAALIN